MKFLKLFGTTSDYETYINGSDKVLPNVSFCEDERVVHYTPIPHDYSQDYLTFVTIEESSFTLKIGSAVPTSLLSSISYSIDNGQTWVTTENVDSQSIVITTPKINAGDKVLWKGNGISMSIANISTPSANRLTSSSIFSSSGSFNIEGNIMSLLYEDNFKNVKTFAENSTSNFALLFYSYNTEQPANVISTQNLVLPATTLTSYCYLRMFQSCPSLTTATELPATTLTEGCYSNMFIACPSLTTAPELPATTLADSCYNGMFYGCTSLTTVPELPATTLAYNCYRSMFNGCTNLTTVPELPATTLASQCYAYMFQNCTSLITVPELPVTTLADACYYGMFSGCTSLTTAPELPATTLTSQCYQGMFNGCTSLSSIKCLATDISARNCTESWVQNVAASGTFTKAASMTSWTTGYNGIPSGWTVVDA